MKKTIVGYKIAQKLFELGYDNLEQWYCEDDPKIFMIGGKRRTTKPFERVKYTLHHKPLSLEEFQKFKEVPFVKENYKTARRNPELILPIPSVQSALTFLKEKFEVSIVGERSGIYGAKVTLTFGDGKKLVTQYDLCTDHHAEYMGIITYLKSLTKAEQSAA
jgi:hypothetical protein